MAQPSVDFILLLEHSFFLMYSQVYITKVKKKVWRESKLSLYYLGDSILK